MILRLSNGKVMMLEWLGFSRFHENVVLELRDARPLYQIAQDFTDLQGYTVTGADERRVFENYNTLNSITRMGEMVQVELTRTRNETEGA